MNIEISTETLKILGISADDYLYLFLLQHKAYDVLNALHLKVDAESLQTNGYLKLGESVKDHVVREKFSSPLSSPFLQLWSELLSHFPLRVESRVLRANDPMAKANEKARLKYEKYVKGDLGKHKEVIKALKTEVELRRNTDQLKYMQQLVTWVNNHTWEKYINIDESKPSSASRITRQL